MRLSRCFQMTASPLFFSLGFMLSSLSATKPLRGEHCPARQLRMATDHLILHWALLRLPPSLALTADQKTS